MGPKEIQAAKKKSNKATESPEPRHAKRDDKTTIKQRKRNNSSG